MTGKENQLKKENQQLRNEIEDLEKQVLYYLICFYTSLNNY